MKDTSNSTTTHPGESPFERAERLIGDHFSELTFDEESGLIDVDGHRYVTIRASNLAFGFHEVVHSVYGDAEQSANVCNSLLFDLSRTMGEGDARQLCDRLGLRDPEERLAAGPAHFAHTGMAVVKIDPASRPVRDDFLLLYEHTQSFEAESWLSAGRQSERPVCIMGCGYSSGWSGVAFDLPLSAVEYTCRACGDDACRFLMAESSQLQDKLLEHLGRTSVDDLYVPKYFGRKDDETKLRTMAFEDQLTGLANRPAFQAKLLAALESADRLHSTVCLLFLDLDGFKAINDQHGHDAGDEALRVAASRLLGATRDSDTVARLGGDEFAVLLPSVARVESAGGVAAKLLSEIAKPFEFHGHQLNVGASIGVGTYLHDHCGPEALVSDADAAMYEAKRAGKRRFEYSANALAALKTE